MARSRKGFADGRRIALQLVGYHDHRLSALTLQCVIEESFGRPCIAPALDEVVDHIAVLVYGPPEVMDLPLGP